MSSERPDLAKEVFVEVANTIERCRGIFVNLSLQQHHFNTLWMYLRKVPGLSVRFDSFHGFVLDVPKDQWEHLQDVMDNIHNAVYHDCTLRYGEIALYIEVN